MNKKRIKTLKSLIDNHSENNSLSRSLILKIDDILKCLEDLTGPKAGEISIIGLEKLVNELIDLLLTQEIDLYSKEVISRFFKIIIDNNFPGDNIDIKRKSQMGSIIIKQNNTVKESVKELKFLIKKVEEYKDATPKVYDLSKEYFKEF